MSEESEHEDRAISFFIAMEENQRRIRKYDLLMTIASSVGFLCLGAAMAIHTTKYFTDELQCQTQTKTEQGEQDASFNSRIDNGF